MQFDALGGYLGGQQISDVIDDILDFVNGKFHFLPAGFNARDVQEIVDQATKLSEWELILARRSLTAGGTSPIFPAIRMAA